MSRRVLPEKLLCAFLSHCPKTQSINRKNSLSYWLKHKLEKFVGQYIPNGSIIAAAVCFGIPFVRESDDSPNIWLDISKDLPITDDINEMAMRMRREED